MTTTDRGFVQSIDVGRGGLVSVDVLLGDGTVATYVISDLDADPERFNERLSKLALLRDAMNRAEPVEIDHDPGPDGEEIERAERITRDTLTDPAAVETVVGLVVGIVVQGQNQAAASAEVPDFAEIALLPTTGGSATYRLDLQIPERTTATDQLDVVRDAYAAGDLVGLTIGAADAQGNQWVLSVATGSGVTGSATTQAQTTMVAGFVESLSLIPLSLPAPFNSASLASVGFTTAPAFTGPGGTVATSPFTPSFLRLLVVEGSLTYLLFKAGLQENLRMEVAATPLATTGDTNAPPTTFVPGTAQSQVAAQQSPAENQAAAQQSPAQQSPAEQSPAGSQAVTAASAAPSTSVPTYLVAGAKLLAPLASAARPVWIQIDRDMLDRGPDDDCVPGVPTGDLAPQGLRDLGIPYTAVWRGLGCFNRGVYRFQIQAPAGVKVTLDGRHLCLYHSDQSGTVFAYACVEGDHEVRIEIERWTCGATFDLDVYRLR